MNTPREPHPLSNDEIKKAAAYIVAGISNAPDDFTYAQLIADTEKVLEYAQTGCWHLLGLSEKS